MHAIVMVHKMQSMTLSNHQLIPTKAESPSGDQGTPADSGEAPCPRPSPLQSLNLLHAAPHHHINVT